MATIPFLAILAAGLALQGAGAGAPDADPLVPLTAGDLQRLHAAIVPKKAEIWEKIPWEVDLFEARDRAFASKKPIFLWSMNGHPLGCT